MSMIVHRLREFLASAAGQELVALVDYFEEHPDELAALIQAQEAAGSPTCSCLCPYWGHLGACTTVATETRVVHSPRFGPVPVPVPVAVAVCGPCGAGIDTGRVTADGDR
jgi:hypothetical protein